MSNQYTKLKVVAVTRETPDAVTIHFEHPERKNIPSKAGQFLTLIIPVNGKQERRSYSLSSAPYEAPQLAVTVKRVPNGLVSNYLVDDCKLGMELEVLEPLGNFKVDTNPANSRNMVLIGAGSGITPLLAMAKAVLHDEPKSRVTLIYGNRNEGTVIFKNKLTDMVAEYAGRFAVEHVFSQPKSSGETQKSGVFKSLSSLFSKKKEEPAPVEPTLHKYTGRLNRKMLIQILENLNFSGAPNTEYYLCGPEGMMTEAREALNILKVAPERIYKESFVTEKEKQQPLEGSVTLEETGEKKEEHLVTLIYEGAEYKVPVKKGQTILEAGLAQEIDLPYSCQAGLCTACRGKCLSGKVHLDERDGLSDAEINEGYVLNCVGHPITDNVVIEIG
ncbi:ferredoxin--NADP reductase [Adhaeribacter aquaticus]|uniref:ferredoxin--NADP reductase n=1 Tax=Adhaeribacter aquaticus TaxID=299567 RepID=UPI0003FACE99|nr:ferredoxin--NADP reductase [Adhaeribacter aquaticus]